MFDLTASVATASHAARAVRVLAAGLAAVVALCAPLQSHAQSCSALRSDLRVATEEMSRVRAKYPLTSVVFDGCFRAAQDDFRRSRDGTSAMVVYTTCAAAACLMATNSDECASVHLRLLMLNNNVQSLERRTQGEC